MKTTSKSLPSAVIYSRVSTELQDAQTQTNDLINYAKGKYKILKVFDETVTGYDPNVERQALNNLKKYVEENKIENILMWEVSRLGRNTLQTLANIEYFKKQGVNIHFKDKNINTLDPMHELLFTITAVMAKQERDQFIMRAKRGRLNAAYEGKAIGFTTLPYGFTKDEKGYLQIDEEEAKIIRYIYTSFANGKSIRWIAKDLNSKGIETRRAKEKKLRTLQNGKQIKRLWADASLRKILHSKLYIGTYEYSNQSIPINKKIIQKDLWDKVQNHFKEHIGYIEATKYKFLLKTKLRCGHCGLHLGGRGQKANGKIYLQYHCYGKHDQSIKCRFGIFPAPQLDLYVWSTLLLYGRTMSAEITKRVNEEFNEEEKKKQIEFYKNEIIKVEERQKRIIKLYKDGDIDVNEFTKEKNSIKRSITDFNESIDQINNEIKLHGELTHEDVKKIFKNIVENSSFEVKRDLINTYIKDVYLYKVDKNDVDLSKVQNISMSREDTFSVINKIGVLLSKKDNLTYIEINLTLGGTLKAVVTNFRTLLFVSDKLSFNKETRHLTLA